MLSPSFDLPDVMNESEKKEEKLYDEQVDTISLPQSNSTVANDDDDNISMADSLPSILTLRESINLNKNENEPYSYGYGNGKDEEDTISNSSSVASSQAHEEAFNEKPIFADDVYEEENKKSDFYGKAPEDDEHEPDEQPTPSTTKVHNLRNPMDKIIIRKDIILLGKELFQNDEMIIEDIGNTLYGLEPPCRKKTSSTKKINGFKKEMAVLRKKIGEQKPINKSKGKSAFKLIFKPVVQLFQPTKNAALMEQSKQLVKRWYEEQTDTRSQIKDPVIVARLPNVDTSQQKKSTNPNDNEEVNGSSSNQASTPTSTSDAVGADNIFYDKNLAQRLEDNNSKIIGRTEALTSSIIEMEIGRLFSKSQKRHESAYLKLDWFKNDEALDQQFVNIQPFTKFVYFPFSIENHYSFYCFNVEEKKIEFFDCLQRNDVPPEQNMEIKGRVEDVVKYISGCEIKCSEPQILPPMFHLKTQHDTAVFMLGLMEAKLSNMEINEANFAALGKRKEILRNFDEIVAKDVLQMDEMFLKKQQRGSPFGTFSDMIHNLKEANFIGKFNLQIPHIINYFQLFIEVNDACRTIAIIHPSGLKEDQLHRPRHFIYNLRDETEIVFLPVSVKSNLSMYFYKLSTNQLFHFDYDGKQSDPFGQEVQQMIGGLFQTIPLPCIHVPLPNYLHDKKITNAGVVIIDYFERIIRKIPDYDDIVNEDDADNVRYNLSTRVDRVKKILNAAAYSQFLISDLNAYVDETNEVNYMISKIYDMVLSARELRNRDIVGPSIKSTYKSSWNKSHKESIILHKKRWGSKRGRSTSKNQNNERIEANTNSPIASPIAKMPRNMDGHPNEVAPIGVADDFGRDYNFIETPAPPPVPSTPPASTAPQVRTSPRSSTPPQVPTIPSAHARPLAISTPPGPTTPPTLVTPPRERNNNEARRNLPPAFEQILEEEVVSSGLFPAQVEIDASRLLQIRNRENRELRPNDFIPLLNSFTNYFVNMQWPR